MRLNNKRYFRQASCAARRLALAALGVVTLGSVAYAENYVGPFSDKPNVPTAVSFSLGDNVVTGATGGFVSNYFTFDVAQGDDLSGITVLAASLHPDLTFIGIESGDKVTATPMSSVGLLGYTLYDSSVLGMNILPAIGASDPPGFPNSSPGATTFTPPLGAGTYSVWVVDGDGSKDGVPFSLDFQISAAPEPSTWALMIAGVGMAGAALRFGRRSGSVATA